ncbi:hypothetical protein DFJ73DRAFT_933325 [Zopfochytrium polystomum]|nr:hypothetical protein DFJ73DRAFT_933325 [Zopfochytrium polystomum]
MHPRQTAYSPGAAAGNGGGGDSQTNANTNNGSSDGNGGVPASNSAGPWLSGNPNRPGPMSPPMAAEELQYYTNPTRGGGGSFSSLGSRTTLFSPSSSRRPGFQPHDTALDEADEITAESVPLHLLAGGVGGAADGDPLLGGAATPGQRQSVSPSQDDTATTFGDDQSIIVEGLVGFSTPPMLSDATDDFEDVVPSDAGLELVKAKKSTVHKLWSWLSKLGYLVATNGERAGAVTHVQLPSDIERERQSESEVSIWSIFLKEDPTCEHLSEMVEKAVQMRWTTYLTRQWKKSHPNHTAHKKDLEAIKKKLEHKELKQRTEAFRRDVLLDRGPEGETILHYALLLRKKSLLRYLLGYGEFADDKKRFPYLDLMINAIYEGDTYYGQHAAHIAVVEFGDNVKMLKRLIARGADIFKPKAKGSYFNSDGSFFTGENVLTFAAVMGHHRIVNYLINEQHYDVNVFDSRMNNVLHVLAWWGFYDNKRPWLIGQSGDDGDDSDDATPVVTEGKLFHQLATGTDAILDEQPPFPDHFWIENFADFTDDDALNKLKPQIVAKGNRFLGWQEEQKIAMDWLTSVANAFGVTSPVAIVEKIEAVAKRKDVGNTAGEGDTWGDVFYDIILWEAELLKAHEPPLELISSDHYSTMKDLALREIRSVDHSVANVDGLTPLGVAAQRGKSKMVIALLDLYSETLWTYGAVTKKSVPLTELDTYVDKMTMNHTKSALTVAVMKEDPEILQNPIFMNLLRAKWILYGSRIFLWGLGVQLLYMLLFTLMIFILPNDRNFLDYTTLGFNSSVVDYQYDAGNGLRNAHIKLLTGKYVDEEDYNVTSNAIRLVVEGILVLWSLFKIYKEAEMMRTNWSTYFAGFGRLENFVQLFLLALFFTGVALRVVELNYWETLVWGLYAIIGWMSLLYYSKGFLRFGPLGLVVWEVLTNDALNFGTILLVFLLGFSQAFWLIMGPFGDSIAKAGGDPGSKEWGNWIPGSFVWLVRGFFGQGASYDTFRYASSHNSYALVLFLVFTFSCNILLLNVFIALINATFGRVLGNAEKRWAVQWAGLIMEIDEKILSKYNQNVKKLRSQKKPVKPPKTAIGIPKEVPSSQVKPKKWAKWLDNEQKLKGRSRDAKQQQTGAQAQTQANASGQGGETKAADNREPSTPADGTAGPSTAATHGLRSKDKNDEEKYYHYEFLVELRAGTTEPVVTASLDPNSPLSEKALLEKFRPVNRKVETRRDG